MLFGEIEWFETGKTGKQHWIVHTSGEMRSSNSAFVEIEWFETGKTGKTALDRPHW